MLISWLRKQREAAFLARCDAEALMFTNGGNAHAEACRRERASLLRRRELSDRRRDRTHWRRVANIISEQTG